MENFYEADWLALARTTATALGVGITLAILPLRWGRWYLRALAAGVAGLATASGANLALLGFLVVMGYVD